MHKNMTSLLNPAGTGMIHVWQFRFMMMQVNCRVQCFKVRILVRHCKEWKTVSDDILRTK